ncbi:MAG: NAD(P)H-dependent oxidoreductase [Synergistaceae bacterium]|jgi:chromate reductase|nr:NAD(P)H-dependent oxidoreductase [Synergistaceae bacterium]
MSKSPRILVFVGGICKDSINKKLFGFFKEAAGETLEFDEFEIKSLPFFSQDIEDNPPSEVVDLKARIKACSGVLLITPEYNRSFPGVLKNALDWGSRPYGQNLWSGKPAGLIGTSPGAIGAFGAQNQLRQVLNFLDFRTMNQPEFYFTFPRELENGKLPHSANEFLKSHPRCQGITNRNETYSDREAKNVYAGDKAAEIDAA